MVLRGEADPHQVGAFLMLLRFRGEDADEIAGMVEAARETIASQPPADLDWPSYGAGRTRGAPWFLLSALALSRAGTRVFMHGSNEYSSGIPVAEGLRAIGAVPDGFRYAPLSELSQPMASLLGMRALFGLRSPVNTVARLLNPANAPAGVDGVFHPPYIDVHLGVAERMGYGRLCVLKGGGGEAERVPLKAATGWLWDRETGRQELDLPPVPDLRPLTPEADTPALLAEIWRGGSAPPTVVATIIATIGIAVLAMGGRSGAAGAWDDAARIWRDRLPVQSGFRSY